MNDTSNYTDSNYTTCFEDEDYDYLNEEELETEYMWAYNDLQEFSDDVRREVYDTVYAISEADITVSWTKNFIRTVKIIKKCSSNNYTDDENIEFLEEYLEWRLDNIKKPVLEQLG